MKPTILPVVALLALAGCAHRQIPGTQIRDTPETRAIIDLMQRYRAAVESQNPDAIAQLVAPDFHDNAGTADPLDDLDKNNLVPKLKERFSKLSNVHLEMEVRSIEVKGETAEAVYYYSLTYEMPSLSDKVQRASDLKQMALREQDGGWRIVSGI